MRGYFDEGLFFLGFLNRGEKRIFYVLLLFLGWGLGKLDVDVKASKFGSEADVLALFADSDRLLVFGNIDFGFFAVYFYFYHFSFVN